MAQRTALVDSPRCYVLTQLAVWLAGIVLMNGANTHIYKHLYPLERWLLECRTRSAARHYRELDAWMDEGKRS